jgi:tRNA-dihydrouridine synthase B
MNQTSPFSIGNIEIRNPVFLAPMSGITDVPFRNLAWKFGAGMVISEMVASEALVAGQTEMHRKTQSCNSPVHVVQLSGRQEYWMGEGVRVAQDAGADIIDINMGCPSKRVTTGYSGSALMRDLGLALRLIDATVKAATVPVTLKMRLGWDHTSINAPELAKRAVDAGVKMITVHGRTRCQFYKGNADWDLVKRVRDAVDVPLVVNGDIQNISDAKCAIAKSGADAVMVGRAAYGAPWLPGMISSQLDGSGSFNEPAGIDLLEIVLEHYDAILSFYDTRAGIRQARKHIGWYFDRLDQITVYPDLRKLALTSENPDEVIRTIKTVFNQPCSAWAA